MSWNIKVKKKGILIFYNPGMFVENAHEGNKPIINVQSRFY